MVERPGSGRRALPLMKIRRAALNKSASTRSRRHTDRAGRRAARADLHGITATGRIGGVDDRGPDYSTACGGDKRTPTKGVGVDDQRKALDALASTLRPSELTVPAPVLAMIAPRPPGYGMHRELFPRTTGDTFDPLSPATVAADVTIGFVLQLDRASRMVAQHAVDPDAGARRRLIGCAATLTRRRRMPTSRRSPRRRAVLIDRLMGLASSSPNGQVRAIASYKLRIGTRRHRGQQDRARHGAAAAARGRIKRFLDRRWIWRGRSARGARRAAGADRRHAGLAGFGRLGHGYRVRSEVEVRVD